MQSVLFTEVRITGYNSGTDFVQRQLQREGLLSETNTEFVIYAFSVQFVSCVRFVPLELNEVIFEGGLSISWRADS